MVMFHSYVNVCRRVPPFSPQKSRTMKIMKVPAWGTLRWCPRITGRCFTVCLCACRQQPRGRRVRIPCARACRRRKEATVRACCWWLLSWDICKGHVQFAPKTCDLRYNKRGLICIYIYIHTLFIYIYILYLYIIIIGIYGLCVYIYIYVHLQPRRPSKFWLFHPKMLLWGNAIFWI